MRRHTSYLPHLCIFTESISIGSKRLLYLFVRSVVRSFVRLVIHLFICPFICSLFSFVCPVIRSSGWVGASVMTGSWPTLLRQSLELKNSLLDCKESKGRWSLKATLSFMSWIILCSTVSIHSCTLHALVDSMLLQHISCNLINFGSKLF